MKLKNGLLICLFFVIVSSSWGFSALANSSDAVAIRIIPNPNNLNVLSWCQNNGLTISPQALIIDGYEAIRSGNTVYLNIANIKNNSLYTNIVVISSTLDADALTVDIFGQIIKNLKFNTNVVGLGSCNSGNEACSYDNECKIGDYCNSQKAKIIRDVNRLEDLEEIKTKLEKYKEVYGFFPKLESGSYMSGISLSVWPSWRQKLVTDIGSNMPIDPLNKLGKCPGFNEITCWDNNRAVFAKDLSQNLLPSGSYIYLYTTQDKGRSAKYCAQMESGYENIKDYNCFDGSLVNRQPTIKSAILSGIPGKEFNGQIVAYDPDGDRLKLEVELISPTSSVWLSNNWRWKSGENNFSVLTTPTINQFLLNATATGNYHFDSDYYKVKLTVDDNYGASNSIYSKEYPININKVPAVLNDQAKTTIIGTNDVVKITGISSEGLPVDKIFFESATFNNQILSESVFNSRGFSLSDANLIQKYTPEQKTGTYIIKVYFLNGGVKVFANISYTLINNAPELKKITANFSNNTTQSCSLEEKCLVSIDNGEVAKINLEAQDSDNHSITYNLFNTDSRLTINDTGVISGLEKLNYNSTSTAIFPISVKMSDSYCRGSLEKECSSTYSFELKIMGKCTIDTPDAMLVDVINGPINIEKSGDILYTGFNKSCSVIGSSTAKVSFLGGNDLVNRNQAIVLISDTSGSMGADITINGTTETAMTRLINALTEDKGFIDQLSVTAKERIPDYFLKLNAISFSDYVNDPVQIFFDLASAPNVTRLKGIISDYSSYGTTDTFSALSRAKSLLDTVTTPNTEKAIVLLSDGLPLVKHYNAKCYCFAAVCGCNLDTFPNCRPYNSSTCTIADNPECTSSNLCYRSSCGECKKYYCGCGGTYPNCDACSTTPPGAYNNLLNFIKFFAHLFNINEVKAAEQTTCKINSDVCDNFPCPQNYFSSIIRENYKLNCDQTSDVDNLSKEIKASGIKIFTVYYKTGSSDEPKQVMCNWSSNNGVNCDNNNYAFSGTNIDEIVDKVKTNLVMYKPRNVLVGGVSVNDLNPVNPYSLSTTELGNLTCDKPNSVVTFSDKGKLVFSNIEIRYCEAKLHP